MSISTLLGNFFKGIQSTLVAAGAVREVLASAIADGVERGANRAMGALVKPMVALFVLATGILLLAWGSGKALESMLGSPGAGFMIIGLVLIILSGAYLAQRR